MWEGCRPIPCQQWVCSSQPSYTAVPWEAKPHANRSNAETYTEDICSHPKASLFLHQGQQTLQPLALSLKCISSYCPVPQQTRNSANRPAPTLPARQTLSLISQLPTQKENFRESVHCIFINTERWVHFSSVFSGLAKTTCLLLWAAGYLSVVLACILSFPHLTGIAMHSIRTHTDTRTHTQPYPGQSGALAPPTLSSLQLYAFQIWDVFLPQHQLLFWLFAPRVVRVHR